MTEEIDLRIRTLVKPECLIQDPPPPPPPTALKYPEYFQAINESYNAPVRMGDKWGVYGVERKLYLSDNNWRYLYTQQTNAPAGSVIKISEDGMTKYFGRQHFKSAFNSDYESRYYKSIDGISWYNIFLDRTPQGEDSNLIQMQNGVIWNFMRPSRIRNLADQTLTSGVSNNRPPSVINSLIFHNTPLALNKDVYCACPIIISDTPLPKFLLFISLYRKGNQGQDVEQPPPYTAEEHTVDGYLYYYNAVSKEIRILNAGQPIIKREGAHQQVYNWPMLDGDTIYINSSVCLNKHVLSQEQRLISRLYTWKLSDALKFIEIT